MKNTGFTLVELIGTVAVAAIVLTVGVPSYQEITLNSRMVSEVNEFIADMRLARSAAIRAKRNGFICISSDLQNCDAAANGDWSNGWIVWIDTDRDNTPDTGEILQVRTALATTSAFASTVANNFSFNSRGLINSIDNLTFCDTRDGETGRTISITGAGRTQLQQVACS